MKIKHGMLLFVLVCLNTYAQADMKKVADPEAKIPLGCRNTGYHFALNALDLKPGKIGDPQALFFVYNALNRPINLYQMLPDDSSRSISLNHVIHARQWAVLATNEKELKYACTVDDAKSPYGKVVNCSDSLKVCQYARVKFGLNNRGNFWMVKGNTSGGAVREVIYYGIIPR